MKQVKVKPVKAPEISSSFAILDVKKGRRALERMVNSGHRFKAKIEMVIDSKNSGDDGVSIEFSGEVIRVEIKPIDSRKPRR